EGQQISAVLTNSIRTTPILFKAEYTPATKSLIRPYIEAGIGGNVISYSQYLGEFIGANDTYFKFALSGGLGVKIPFNKTTARSGVKLGGNFNYMPFDDEITDNLNNIGVHAGVYFPL
ncbi:MAG: hypothetical protein H7Y03_11400, partial [Chitinophagaceae bacterium]|nr:hypothetical protein [Chitinophagaceae bacterium]